MFIILIIIWFMNLRNLGEIPVIPFYAHHKIVQYYSQARSGIDNSIQLLYSSTSRSIKSGVSQDITWKITILYSNFYYLNLPYEFG